MVDEHHLLAVSAGATTLTIYRIDPASPSPPTSVADTERSFICRLALPALAPDCVYVIRRDAAVQGRPASFPDCTSHFVPDPSHALLAVHYFVTTLRSKDHRVGVNPEGDGDAARGVPPPPRSHLLLIPAETILAHARRFSRDSEAQASEADAEIEAVTMSWDEWGPKGAVTLALAERVSAVSVCGSRALLVFQGRGADGGKVLDVLTVDVHPYASVRASKPRLHSHDSDGGSIRAAAAADADNIARLIVPQEEVYARMSGCFLKSGQGRPGRYPCRVRHRQVKLGGPVDEVVLRTPNWRVILTDDTFGFPVSDGVFGRLGCD